MKPRPGETIRINAEIDANLTGFVVRSFIMAAAFLYELASKLEADTESSRECARSRIVQIIYAARCDAVDRSVCVHLGVVTGVVRDQPQIVGREESPRSTTHSCKLRHVEGLTYRQILNAGERPIFVELRRITL